MSLRDQAKTSLPLVLRKSFSQTNALELELEQFEREQMNAVTKALSILESPVKEKHVRTLIIGTFKQKSSNFMWNMVSSRAPLHGNPIVCWKFCSVLHKILREGHQKSVPEAGRHVGLLEDLGKLWGHLKEGYGRLISFYAKLLVRKLQFHERYPVFPGNLSVEREQLLKAGNNDAGSFYELCIEFLDYLEDIIHLQAAVFDSLDMSKANSMTSSGQCRLGPLIVCIQDSVHLYDYSVKIIFLLHQHLPPDTLAGHTARFLTLFHKLRKFYANCSNLQYFKNLVQVPSLPDHPPNFLVASEIGSHVTPVAVVPDLIDESEFESSDTSSIMADPVRDERDSYIDQLLVEIETLQGRVSQLEQDRRRMEQTLGDTQDRLGQEAAAGERYRAEIAAAQAEVAALAAMVQQQREVQQDQDKSRSMEDKFNKLKEVYQKLREEHIGLLRKKAEVDKHLAGSNITKDEALRDKEAMEKKVEDMLREVTLARADLNTSKQEQDVQVHNMQASLGSLQSKVMASEEELRRREDREKEVEKQLLEKENSLIEMRLKLSDAEQNKHNLEEEILDLTTKLKILTVSEEGQKGELSEWERKYTAAAGDLATAQKHVAESRDREGRAFTSAISGAVEQLQNVANVEDINSISCSGQTMISVCKIASQNLQPNWPQERSEQISLILKTSHGMCLAWGLSRGVANTCPDIELSTRLLDHSDRLRSEGIKFYETLHHETNQDIVRDNMGLIREILDNLIAETERIEAAKGEEMDLASLVQQEIEAMDQAIEEAAKKIEDLLAASRANDSGEKLEVNEKVLDSCTSLVKAIRELVKRSKSLQQEILEEGRGRGSEKEFYKKNSRWTEGLISAAKAVGLGAKLLVDSADKVVLGNGRFEEIMAASQEIAGSTAQLVIASRVKARQGSSSFTRLREASKVVTQATGAVVAVAKSCIVRAEDVELDFSKMSAHQTKTMEMEAQVKLLELEQQVEVARMKLAALRRNNYKTGQDGVD